MKSLQESLFDSKTQMTESLFDNDLVTRKIGILDVITNLISDYESGSHTIKDWEKCLLGIVKIIKYNYTKGRQLTPQKVCVIKDDELYVNINVLPNYSSITLIGWGLTGTSLYKACPPIVRIVFSPNEDNIYLDIYQTPTVDYKDILFTYKFNYYKINKGETINFVDNVFTKLETVF